MALTIRLRWPLIHERIDACGGTMAVTRRAGLDRSTLTRWRKHGKLPNDPLRFLRLAQALDLDPLLLFDLDETTFAETCIRVAKLLVTRRLAAALGSLAFIEGFWQAAGGEWPPRELRSSSGTVAYRWHLQQFRHEGQLGTGAAGRNFYASIPLRGPRVERRSGPQVWHFAFRDALPMSLWIQYGAVALVGDVLELYAFAGRHRRVAAPGPIAAETWFGEGDAEFRIASLHPFTADVIRDPPAGHAAVRFELPRIGWGKAALRDVL